MALCDVSVSETHCRTQTMIGGSTMTRVEYRFEQVPLNRDGPPTLQLVERLAELGRHGWHVASVDLTPHPSYEAGPVTVLLEREVDGAALVEHQAASEASTDRDLPLPSRGVISRVSRQPGW